MDAFRTSISDLDPDTVLVNTDETPVWFDNPSKYRVTKKGTKRVSQRATLGNKKRITVVFFNYNSNSRRASQRALLAGIPPGLKQPDALPHLCSLKMETKTLSLFIWAAQKWAGNSLGGGSAKFIEIKPCTDLPGSFDLNFLATGHSANNKQRHG
jgi:hypothetical protein